MLLVPGSRRVKQVEAVGKLVYPPPPARLYIPAFPAAAAGTAGTAGTAAAPAPIANIVAGKIGSLEHGGSSGKLAKRRGVRDPGRAVD